MKKILILLNLIFALTSQADVQQYAQCADDKIVGLPLIDDSLDLTPWTTGYQCTVLPSVEGLSPAPQIGWTCNGGSDCTSFSAPSSAAPAFATTPYGHLYGDTLYLGTTTDYSTILAGGFGGTNLPPNTSVFNIRTISDSGFVPGVINNYGSEGFAILFLNQEGTEASPFPTQRGDALLHIAGTGYNGSGFNNDASVLIEAKATQNFSAGKGGAYFGVNVVPVGTDQSSHMLVLAPGGQADSGASVTLGDSTPGVDGTPDMALFAGPGGVTVVSPGTTALQGALLVGSQTTTSTSKVTIDSETASADGVYLYKAASDSGPGSYAVQASRGTIDSPEALDAGDGLFSSGALGFDGSDYGGNGYGGTGAPHYDAGIYANATQPFTSEHHGTHLALINTPMDSINPTTVFDADSAGVTSISNTTVKLQGLEYPDSDGSAGQVVTTDGSGALGFSNPPALVTLALNTGSLTGLAAGEIVGTGKTSRAITIENLVAAPTLFTCAVNPVITLYDCGTSAGACSSGTAKATLTLTTINTQVDGTISNGGTIEAGHYWAFEVDSGTCTALTASGTATGGMQ